MNPLNPIKILNIVKR